MDDRFDGVATFLHIVDSGSLTLAAERLNLTRSAVGKALARLEGRLGVRLLHRTTRSQRLTEDGQAYYEHCLRAQAELDAAEAGLQSGQREPRGTLRVSVPLAFGHHYAAPALLGLAQRFAQLQIDIRFGDRVVDLAQEGFDLAVRIGELPDSDQLVARRLGMQAVGLAAAPAYLERHGTPAGIDDLARHRRIGYSGAGAEWGWEVQGPDGSPRPVRLPASISLDDVQAMADAAIAGLGLAWLPTWLRARYVESGQLAPVLDSYRARPQPVHAVWLRSRHLPAKTRCAIDALVACIPPRMEQP
ncbi:MAG: LysR family transcriptional regulator [Comamonas sp.]